MSPAWEPIAIVGMGCRWPGDSSSPQAFWELLAEGRSAQADIPKSRFNADAFYHPNIDRPGSFIQKGGYFVKEDVRNFDPVFFGITPAEAMSLDPMQRKFLEVVYECFESAGATLEGISGSKTGCFVGNFNDDMVQTQVREAEYPPPYHVTGTGVTIISNRINYVFNLQGPSLTIDTACSSSMYALHLACLAIHAGDCTAAVVGGTNLIQTVEPHLNNSKLGTLSPTSACHTFDASADGYARGDGIGALYVKKLSDALKDGDPIRAVIRGTSFNANGKTPGITNPSRSGQYECMRMAYAHSGLDPQDTSYVEAHGTGTPAGDPIEVSAIGEFFRLRKENSSTSKGPTLIGSVKTNIGHTEPSSGIAAIMKCVLAFEKGIIPPTIGIKKLNPKIDFDGLNVKVVTEPIPWPSGFSQRRASVNSFGYGGTNAHVILDAPDSYVSSKITNGINGTEHATSNGTNGVNGTEHAMSNGINRVNGAENATLNGTNGVNGTEYAMSNGTNGINGTEHATSNGAHDNVNGIEEKRDKTTQNGSSNGVIKEAPTVNGSKMKANGITAAVNKSYLLTCSGHSEPTLQQNVQSLQSVAGKYNPEDLSYTMSSRRSHFFYRAYAVAADFAQKDVKFSYGKRLHKALSFGFVFTGQGALWSGVGVSLMNAYPSFLNTIRKLDTMLVQLQAESSEKWSIERCLRSPTTEVSDVRYSQPLCSAIQIALVDLLDSWGIKPSTVVGHSSGEIAAAYAARRLSMFEAIAVAYLRGACVSNSPLRGRMLAVGLGVSDVEKYLTDSGVQVACHNSPQSVTLSGAADAIDAVKEQLDGDRVFARKLETGGAAYHSSEMKSIGKSYQKAMENAFAQEGTKLDQRTPVLPMYSSVTGRVIEQKMPSSYWVQNLECPVRFDQAIASMAQSSSLPDAFIEIGPHPALRTPLRDNIKVVDGVEEEPRLFGTLQRKQNCQESLLRLAGELFLLGHPVNFDSIQADSFETHKGKVLFELPKYGWNYSEMLWQESRVVKQWKYRQFPRHDLLGSILPGSLEDDTRVWRNLLAVKDVPWLQDHMVHHEVVFPAAGYIAMAVEAVRQTCETKKQSFTGVTLKNVHFPKALPLREDAPTEMILTLKPARISGTSVAKLAYEFSISVVKKEVGSVHSHGSIEIKVGHLHHRPREEQFLSPDTLLESIESSYDHDRWYRSFTDAGLKYGDNFRGLYNIKSVQKVPKAAAQVYLDKSASFMHHQSRYAVHPTAIDACLQLAIVAAYEGLPHKLREPTLPISFKELYVAIGKENLPTSAQARAEASRVSRRVFELSTDLIDSSDPEGMLLSIRGLEAKIVPSAIATPIHRSPYMRLVSKPDISTLNNSQLLTLYPPGKRGPLGVEERIQRLERLAVCIICEVLERKPDWHPKSPELQHYLSWMVSVAELPTSGGLRAMPSAQRQEEIARLSRDSHPEGAVLMALYQGLLASDDEKFAGPEKLFKDERLDVYYHKSELTSGGLAQAQNILDLVAHKDPKMNILQIGARTGATTKPLLDTLQGSAHFPRYKQYTYTDASSENLQKGENLLEEYKKIEFTVLDIEQDLAQQSFTPGSYDLVIATNILHTTANLENAIRNVRQLLKSTGILLIIETTTERIFVETIMGVFPGYWKGYTEDRGFSPFIDSQRWNNLLSSAGFNVSAILDDFPLPSSIQSAILATAIEVPASDMAAETVPNGVSPSEPQHSEILILNERDPTSISNAVAESFKDVDNISITQVKWTEATITSLCRVISFVDFDTPRLASLTPEEWAQFQTLATHASTILWVTNGKLLRSGPKGKPENGMINGIIRTLRIEQPKTGFCLLDFDWDVSQNLEKSVKMVKTIESKLCAVNSKVRDLEYHEVDGLLRVGRVVPDETLNDDFRHNLGAPEPKAAKFGALTAPKLDIGKVGMLGSLYFTEDHSVASYKLRPHEVVIRTMAVGVNMKDYTTLTGMYEGSNLSNECSGIIEKVGSDVKNVAPGDRVVACAQGSYGAYHITPGDRCHKLSLTDDFVAGVVVAAEEMATMPVVFSTALYCFTDLCRLSREDSVLIQSAAGGLGQACIQIAKSVGAEIFATCGTQEKKKFLLSQGVEEDHIFVCRDDSFIKPLLNKTHGVGVDVIMCTAAGELYHSLWDALAPMGKFIDAGRKEVIDGGKMALEGFKNNGVFISLDLLVLADTKPKTFARIFSNVMSLYRQGVIRPITPVTVFRQDQIGEAMLSFSRGLHTGKLVISYQDQEALVKAVKLQPPFQFKEEASYLVVGGLGGLGRSLAMWMASKGCKSLVVISRSGASSEEAQAAVRDLERLGVTVQIVKGDACNAHDISKCIIVAKYPIRGVVQGAMVLRDWLLEKMSLEDFMAGVRPKVACTWALHKAFLDAAQDLDFFIMISSGAGITGTATQSNYNAGNTFQDAFARYRHAHGLPATALSLGMVLDVGYVGVNRQAQDALERVGMWGIAEHEFHGMMEVAMGPANIDLSNGYDPLSSSHIVTGFETHQLTSITDKGFIGSPLLVTDTKFGQIFGDFEDLYTGKKTVAKTGSSTRSGTITIEATKAMGYEKGLEKFTRTFLERVGTMLFIPPEQLDPNKSVSDYGIDSMIAAELKNWVYGYCGVDVTFLDFLNPGFNIKMLAGNIWNVVTGNEK